MLVVKVKMILDLSILSFLIENILPASILVPVLIFASFLYCVRGFITSYVGPCPYNLRDIVTFATKGIV